MLTLEQIKTILQDRNISKVARNCNLNITTVWKIKRGVAGNVGYETVEKLSDYLEKNE